PSHDQSALHRIANYLSFALSSLLMGPWLVKNQDVIYVYNLVTLGPTAFLLRFLHKSKVIIDVQDLWPQSVASSGMLANTRILSVLNMLCNWVYKKANRIVVLSPGFESHLVNRGVSPEKIKIIYNWCDESMQKSVMKSSTETASHSATRFVVLYAGAMGVVQGLDTLLGCAEICKGEMPDVHFILIGDGADRMRLQEKCETMNLNNVTFLERRSSETMGEIYDLADVLIVHLQDDPLFRITIPSKTQAYLYIGKPLIMAMRGDAAELVRQSGAGVICEPGNPLAMVAAVRNLYNTSRVDRDKMGEAGYRYYMEHLSFAQGVNKFKELMISAVEHNKE
ncbi:MAG TPA: glycosyltransferase family 4 protein, partial [Smithellaceae bacterium]|nr:glycosyltransferase family 4 protein [Smithellaceae bacterium]